MSAPLQIGLVLFPRVTQLDFTGPLQVFSSVPGAQVHLVWKRIEPVPSDSVMTLFRMTIGSSPQRLRLAQLIASIGVATAPRWQNGQSSSLLHGDRVHRERR